MQLTFSWPTAFRREVPTCTADVQETGGLSPLSRILEDDGGVDRATRIDWIREGIRRVVEAEQSTPNVVSLAWAGEECAAVISSSSTKVRYLLEDGHEETISTASFRLVLEAWLKFLLAGSTIGAVTLAVLRE